MGKGGKGFDKKKKYLNFEKGHSRTFNDLEYSPGFLVTCNESKERNAVRDVYNMLNDYLDELCEEKGIPSHINSDIKPKTDFLLEKRPVDLDDKEAYEFPSKKMLKNENDEQNNNYQVIQDTSSIKNSRKNSEKEKGNKTFVFKQIKLKAKGLLFVKMDQSWAEKVTPFEISQKILEDVNTNQKQLSKFCHKLYPIQYAFDANFNTFKHFIEKIFDEHFPSKKMDVEGENDTNTNIGSTWNLYYRCRANNKFDKQKFLSFFMEFMPNCFPIKQVHPDKQILIDITQVLFHLRYDLLNNASIFSA